MKSHFCVKKNVLTLALGLFSLTSGISFGNNPDGSAFTSSLPERWLYVPDHLQTSPSEDRWWKEFGDSVLNDLIAKAEKNNFNVASAMKRIALADKEMAITRSSYWPNVGVSAGWRQSQSAGAAGKTVSSSVTSSNFSAGVSMSWEIDVFGRIQRQLKADKAAIAVSRADYDAVMVSLCANVAQTYLQLRMYQMQHQVATDHIASQEKVLKIAEARQEAGIGDMLEVTQARIVLYSTRSSLPGLKASIRSTANALAVLTGTYPAEIVPQLLVPADLPPDMGMPSIGVPADLLRRRPDIVEAEAQLAQYAAMIGVAKSDFLPVLTLDGSIGTAAHRLDNMFGAHSLEYSIAPTLSWTVFDGLARNYKVQEARIQLEQATDNYNLTVLNAIEEVENAVARYNAYLQEIESLNLLIEQSRKSLELSLDLYKQGLTAFSNVVDAQQSYLENQNSLVSSRGAALMQLVSLYQAMGGGY